MTPATLLGPKYAYTDAIDLALLQLQAEANKKPVDKNPLRPSAAGYCARKLAYSFYEFANGMVAMDQEEKNPSTMRLLDLGNPIEWHVIKQLEKVADIQVRFKQQVLSFFRLPTGHLVEGSLDLVVFSPDGKGIGDVKSKKDKFSSYRDSKWSEHSEKFAAMKSLEPIGEGGTSYWANDLEAFLHELPSAIGPMDATFLADNFYQCNFYACNEFIKERGIDHGFIIQYNKNDSRMREIRFRPSPKLAHYVEDKYKEIARNQIETNNPENVKREFTIGSARCAFCERKARCWPGEDALKAWFRTWPKKEWPVDTSRTDDGPALEALYEEFLEAYEAAERKPGAEEMLVQALMEAEINKVRFADGNVWEVKPLKSGPALRRSKA